MREIKFRAWDKDYKYMKHKVMVGNVWDEGNYHAHMIWVDAEDVDYECESGWMDFDEHSNIELMQYTGLKDKNGVEIYEGDLLKAPDGYIGLIEYHPTRAQFVGRNAGMDFVDTEFDTLYTDYGKLNFSEVIGNLYENPELLEREAE